MNDFMQPEELIGRAGGAAALAGAESAAADFSLGIEEGITLAEALQMRADAQKRIAQLGARLRDNAKVQEGDAASEDPLTLIALLDANTATYEELIRRINRTNAETMADGETLTALLAKRDALRLSNSIMRAFLQEASQRVDRYAKSEIRILSTVDVPKLQARVDERAKELRLLETKIQRLNWTTTLI